MSDIECPHCKMEYSDDDMYYSKHDLYSVARDEDEVEETCTYCKEIFWIRGGYLPLYTIAKTEEGLEYGDDDEDDD